MSGINYRQIVTTNTPEKSLVKGYKRGTGRNVSGKITTRHKGGGHKRLFRDVDFSYDKHDVPYTIKTVEYDPNRSGFIGLAQYKDGEKRYILLHQSAAVGDTYVTSEKAEMLPGNRMPLGNMLVGTFVYNIALRPKGGAKLARSGGDYAELLAKDGGYVDIKLPSSEVRKIPVNAWASIGEVSNNENRLVKLGKAGRSRWLGIRPTVRGTAMNPCDHKYGGGEQRQPRGTRRPKDIWGNITGGKKTRNRRKWSNALIVRRRPKIR